MVWVSGADGCRAGWFRVSRESETAELRFHLIERAGDLLRVPPRPAVLALDIPIGLPDAGPRDCDRRARRCLGAPRGSSVFHAPIRPALHVRDRQDASRITQRLDGRRVGAQAWGLYRKIREVDALLQSNPDARGRLREAHPEVCFWAWAGGRVMSAAKKTAQGRAERCRLAESWLGPSLLARGRLGHAKTAVADDDILDAVGVLWTADRILHGDARRFPEAPPLDSTGLPMEIVY